MVPFKPKWLAICELQFHAFLGGKKWERNVLVMHRAILFNQNINILIELMESLKGNTQLQTPSLGVNLQNADRV